MKAEPKVSLEEAKAIVAEKTAPKVTEQSIKEKIAEVSYYNDDLLTICIITMQNGFKFVGKSAPASADNFDREVGKRYAYEDAFKQIWPHEGYLLRERLYRGR